MSNIQRKKMNLDIYLTPFHKLGKDVFKNLKHKGYGINGFRREQERENDFAI